MSTIPVFFCERTGESLYYVGFRCECGHYTSEHSSEAEYKKGWESRFTKCGSCGAHVKCTSAGSKPQFRRADTGELLYDLPAGACFEYTGYGDDPAPHNWRQAPRADGREYLISRANEQDGRVLAVVCPDGHHWIIDSRASNCDMKADDEHWCWVRHGRPEDGTLHVDKAGRTCGAGAGSILTHSGWHGFLHHGALRPC